MDKAGANDVERFCDPNDTGTDLLLSVSMGLELDEAISESSAIAMLNSSSSVQKSENSSNGGAF